MNENLKAILEEEISVYLSFKDVLDYFDYIDTYPDEIEGELLTLATLVTTVTWSEYEELLVDPKIDYIEIYNKDEVYEPEYETGVRINGQSYSDLQAGPLTNPHVINRWNAGYTGRGVNLLIIDNYFENAYNQSGVLDISFKQIIDYTNSTSEWNDNHGMAMSSYAAAKLNNSGLVGAAYNCNLYGAACGVGDKGGIGGLEYINALNWAVQNKMDIVSMSFGHFGGYSTTVHNSIKNCYNNNILLFASAGNNYGDINPNTTKYTGPIHYPSDYTEVICVSSVMYNETTKTYTNQYIYSDHTDISMHSPRRSYNLKGTNSYNTIRDRGTSQTSATSGATAYTAGIAATIKEQYPNITREQFLYLMNKNKTSVAYGLGYVPNLSSYGEKVYSIKDSSAELGWRGCEMNIISGGSTPIYHTVQAGDSWWGIANNYGYAATLEQIYAWNNANANTVIHPGDKVIVGYK